ncbi:hypothetical protein V6N11_082454 [Hibiscus sabdariffa]|uniref:Uncharacterized protein n=2 Tax=Hibiscus sabdariffa TaxID=183260 RepID=A0ABR2BV77_9ROSI
MVLLLFSLVELCDIVLAATEVWSAWFSRIWVSYLRVDVATEEPSSFERAQVLIVTSFPRRIDEVVQVTVQDSVYSIVIQEAVLVRILTVEQPEEGSGTDEGDESHRVSVASPAGPMPGEQTRVASPWWQANCLWDSGQVSSDGNAVKQARSLDVVVGHVGTLDALTCFGGGLRGVCSADDKPAGDWDRSRVAVEARMTPESVDNRESPLGLIDCAAASSRMVIADNNLSSSLAVLGVTDAALAPMLGTVLGGVRKVKSVNCLVEALASPEQRRSIIVARARRGRG